MESLVRQKAVEAPRNSGQRSFREVCQAAVRVFNLMDKYHTAPYPNAYAVLFAYTTGSDESLVAEINDLLQLKDQISPYDIESLYQEYLANEEGTFSTQDIGQAIGNEIGTVLEIIEKGLKHNVDFTSSLDTFAEKVPQAMADQNLETVVSGLLEENRRMVELTRELNHGLAKSQGLITVLNQQLEEVQAQNLRDPVTSVFNRRAFEKRVDEAAAHAAKSKEGFCVVITEIDDFRALGDKHGPEAGDAVLQGFASLVAANLHEDDMVARYGDQTFAIFLSGRDLMSAYNLLIKIKHSFKLATVPVPGSAGAVSGVTASFGLARLEPGMASRDVLKQADDYLQDAKKSGRNLVKARGIG